MSFLRNIFGSTAVGDDGLNFSNKIEVFNVSPPKNKSTFPTDTLSIICSFLNDFTIINTLILVDKNFFHYLTSTNPGCCRLISWKTNKVKLRMSIIKGYVYELEIGESSGFIGSYFQLFPNVEKLSVSGLKVRNEGFKHLKQLKCLEINLCHGKKSKLTDSCFVNLPNLEKLSVSNSNKFKNAGFKALKNLKKLYLYYCDKITDEIFKSLPNLTKIDLCSCHGFKMKGFSTSNLKNVEYLVVNRCRGLNASVIDLVQKNSRYMEYTEFVDTRGAKGKIAMPSPKIYVSFDPEITVISKEDSLQILKSIESGSGKLNKGYMSGIETFKCKLKNNHDIVVRSTANISFSTVDVEQSIKNFEKELMFWDKNHSKMRNFLPILGYFFDEIDVDSYYGRRKLYVGFEFCPKSNLKNFCESNKGKIEVKPTKIRILSEVAEGLCDYHQKGMVLGSLIKYSRVLLTGLVKVRIAPCILEKLNSSLRRYGTNEEWFRNLLKVGNVEESSFSSDIFAFGLLAYEFLSEDWNFEEVRKKKKKIRYPKFNKDFENKHKELTQLVYSCMNKDEKLTFKIISKRLRDLGIP